MFGSLKSVFNSKSTLAISLLLILFWGTIRAHAEEETATAADSAAIPLTPLTRWAVFPFSIADDKLKESGDKAWWNLREQITSKKRFMVASKQFLIQREVFQPRKELSRDDVQYLAQHLEADVLVTGYSEYRDFKLNIYLAQTGDLIWTKKLTFHPSLRASDQILRVSERLVAEALRAIPYHGVSVEIEEQPQLPHTVAIDVGLNDNLNVGDEINLFYLSLPQRNKDDDESVPLSFEKIVSQYVTTGKVSSVKKKFAIVQLPPKESIREPFFASVLKELNEASYQDKLAMEMSVGQNGDPSGESLQNPPEKSRSTLVFGSVFSFLGFLLLIF